MGGLRWIPGDRSNIEDHRFDPPAIRSHGDAVDAPAMTPKCHRCRGGQLPEFIRVTNRTVFTRPRKGTLVTLSCADCQHPLSQGSLAKVNHQIVKVVVYE